MKCSIILFAATLNLTCPLVMGVQETVYDYATLQTALMQHNPIPFIHLRENFKKLPETTQTDFMSNTLPLLQEDITDSYKKSIKRMGVNQAKRFFIYHGILQTISYSTEAYCEWMLPSEKQCPRDLQVSKKTVLALEFISACAILAKDAYTAMATILTTRKIENALAQLADEDTSRNKLV